MRRPEPWYWEKRKGWYVQIRKSQEKLGADPTPRRGKDGRPQPPEEVMREYYRLMASNNLLKDREREHATVAEVAETFLATKTKLASNSRRSCAFFMKKLAATLGRRRFATLRIQDLEAIPDAMETWGETTRRDFMADVIDLFRWAKDAGFVDFNILAGYTNPYHAARRERAMTDDEYARLMDAATDLEFKRIMSFLRGTGCRPGEACKLTAAHIDPVEPFVVLSPVEHKTGYKTRRKRVIPMPDSVLEMVRNLARLHPTGPLFRNTRGDAWRPHALQSRFRRYRAKLGMGKDVVPYLLRHASISRMLDAGHASHLVAAIHGQISDQTTLGVYYHAGRGLLLDAVNDADAAAGTRPRRPAGVKTPDA